jgi:nitroreductase
VAGLEANGRAADHDVHPMFLHRWSPRAFTGEPMPDDLLMSLFEAARWAPSAFNGQPWRFVYAHKGTEAWDRLFDVLIPSVHSHSFDAGAAWACLALQASHIGWAAHGMAGFDLPRSYEVLGLAEDQYRVEAAIAVGRPTGKEILDEPYRSREAPSPRNPVSSFAFEGRFRI